MYSVLLLWNGSALLLLSIPQQRGACVVLLVCSSLLPCCVNDKTGIHSMVNVPCQRAMSVCTVILRAQERVTRGKTRGCVHAKCKAPQDNTHRAYFANLQQDPAVMSDHLQCVMYGAAQCARRRQTARRAKKGREEGQQSFESLFRGRRKHSCKGEEGDAFHLLICCVYA